jgi:hypothetical protein
VYEWTYSIDGDAQPRVRCAFTAAGRYACPYGDVGPPVVPVVPVVPVMPVMPVVPVVPVMPPVMPPVANMSVPRAGCLV